MMLAVLFDVFCSVVVVFAPPQADKQRAEAEAAMAAPAIKTITAVRSRLPLESTD